MPPEPPVGVDRAVVDVHVCLVRQAGNGPRAGGRVFAHIGATRDVDKGLFAGHFPRRLGAMGIDVVPPRVVLVEVDPATSAAAAGGAAFAAVEEAGAEADLAGWRTVRPEALLRPAAAGP